MLLYLFAQEDTNLEFMNHLQYLRSAKSLYLVSDEETKKES